MVVASELPVLAITLGDPAGIGTEVALGALVARPRLRARVLLVGDPEVVRARARRLPGVPPIERLSLSQAIAAGRPQRASPVVVAPDRPALRPDERRPGRPTRGGARMAYESIRTAVALVQAGLADALVTAPVSKEWFARAGVARTGHTEILAELTGASAVRMMMATSDLRVVLATIHLAIQDVPGSLDVAGVAQTIALTDEHLRRWWGIRRPRIAVAGLNPHAGDGGVYGDEETRIVRPALRRARRRGVDARGPYAADTMFSAIGPRADAYVAMYHDQGLIPIKQLDVHRAVNVTLGLPFIRTSPDHGTAYDLAGTGKADPGSMRAALDLALALAPAHRRRRARGRQGSGRPPKRGSP